MQNHSGEETVQVILTWHNQVGIKRIAFDLVPQHLSYAGIVSYLRWCSDIAMNKIEIKDNMEIA